MGSNNIKGSAPKTPTKIENREKLVWIDKNINNNENKRYQVILKDMNFDLLALENENEGINEIKKFKFEKINVLISGSLFKNFINLIKIEKLQISCAFNIIVFTSIKGKQFLEEMCNKEKDILNGFLFRKKNIFCSINEIQDFLLTLGKNDSENEKEEIFEKIERDEQILPHIYYQQLLKPITKEEIHNFNQYLIDMHGMKELIGQLENIAEMPHEVICKYWVRAYTLETSFYRVMRHKLQTKKGKVFCPYIKMMYEGIKNKTLKPKYDKELYNGSIISYSELNRLEECLNEPKESLFPKLILYFRSFKSFSLSKDKAIDFMNKSPPLINHKKVLFIIKTFNLINISTNVFNQELEYGSNLINEFLSNAYIKEFSDFPDEEEVLFFPFSSFEVTKIDREFSDHVEITLEYLGKYRKNININPQNILLFFQTSEFGKEILELQLINYKRKYSWNADKEIYIEDGNVSSILYLENKLILFSVDNIIKLYNIHDNKEILNINIHQNKINDLLKVGNHKFISSSKDNTIKYFELNANYLNYKILETINIHTDQVNQTIKLKMDNYYASCSDDKNICIWSFEMNKNENSKFRLYKVLKGHESHVVSIFGLSDNSIISVSKAGLLKFWEKDTCLKSLEFVETPLNHSISCYSENLIVIGTNRSIIFVDILQKEIVFIIPLNFISTSFCNFYGNIILGLEESNYCFLREFEILKNKNSFDLVAEGKDDKTLEISFIQILDETTIITANKEKYIKIWKKGNIKMPRLSRSYSSNNIVFILGKEEKSNIIYESKELELKEKEKKFNKIEEAEKELEIKITKLKEKEKELNEKEMELKEKEIILANEYNIKEVEDKNNSFMKENIIAIKIISFDQKVNFSVTCNKNDKFVKIEELLYESYPEYKDTENYYICNGNKINKFKTLEENHIHNNNIITLNTFEY